MRYCDLLLEAVPLPDRLYHGTLKTAIADILAHGLQPRTGRLWHGQSVPPLVFAADTKHRRKLVAVMLQQIAHSLGTPMNAVTAEAVMDHGAIAVITDTTPFERAIGTGRPLPFLELGDYYTDKVVPVNQFMDDAEMGRFLGAQFRIWTRMVQTGEA